MVSPLLSAGTLICLGMRVCGEDSGSTALVYLKEKNWKYEAFASNLEREKWGAEGETGKEGRVKQWSRRKL